MKTRGGESRLGRAGASFFSNPKLLAPWTEALLGRMVDATEKQAALESGADGSTHDADGGRDGANCGCAAVVADDRSSIVKTCTMQGLTGLTRWNPAMLPEVLDMLRLLSRCGTPAMRARVNC